MLDFSSLLLIFHAMSTLEPAYKVHGCKVFLDARSIFSQSLSESALLN